MITGAVKSLLDWKSGISYTQLSNMTVKSVYGDLKFKGKDVLEIKETGISIPFIGNWNNRTKNFHIKY